MSGVRFASVGFALVATLLSLSGCKPGAQKNAVTTNTVLIGTDDSGKPEPHQPIAQGVIVHWRSPQNFSITFKKDKDPCVANQTGHDDTYNATPPGNSDPEYTLSCTISNNPQRGDKYKYDIALVNASGTPAASPAAQPAPADTKAAPAQATPLGGASGGGGVTGCGGCVLAVDSE